MSASRTLRILAAAGALALSAPHVAAAQGGGQNGQGTGQATFGNLIAALNNVAVSVQQLQALNNIDISKVKVIQVSNLLNGNNVQAFNNALNRNNVQILNLTNTLNNNTVLTNFLNNANIAINRVVAVDVLSGGGINLYVAPAVTP